jgi:hypothetical protein
MTVKKDKNEILKEPCKDITSNTSDTTGDIPIFTTGDGDSSGGSSSSDKKLT